MQKSMHIILSHYEKKTRREANSGSSKSGEKLKIEMNYRKKEPICLPIESQNQSSSIIFLTKCGNETVQPISNKQLH